MRLFRKASFIVALTSAGALTLAACGTTPSTTGTIPAQSHAVVALAQGGGATGGGGGATGGSGGGGATGGGGGGGGGNLQGTFVADAAFGGAFGSFRVQRVGVNSRVTGDIVNTGLPGDHLVNGVVTPTFVRITLNGAPYLLSSVMTAPLQPAFCPDATAASTDCVPLQVEINGAGTGVVAPVIPSGSRLDFTAVNGDGLSGVNLFGPSVPVIGHLGSVVLK